MKEVFNELKQRLYDNREHYVYEDVDGELQFDGEALMSEIDGFANEFISKIN
jgi:hypothetical protein